MTNTLLHYQSTIEKFLLSSTKFWSILSTVAIIVAFSSFYSTHHQYTDSFTTKYIISAFIFIALHLIIILSDLKNTFAPFFLGSGILKWTLRITAMSVAYLLRYVPENLVARLTFVICVWIDIIAITRILKLSIDLWVANSVFMAVVGRTNDMYGVRTGYWVIIFLCFPVTFLQFRLGGYKDDEQTKENDV